MPEFNTGMPRWKGSAVRDMEKAGMLCRQFIERTDETSGGILHSVEIKGEKNVLRTINTIMTMFRS